MTEFFVLMPVGEKDLRKVISNTFYHNKEAAATQQQVLKYGGVDVDLRRVFSESMSESDNLRPDDFELVYDNIEKKFKLVHGMVGYVSINKPNIPELTLENLKAILSAEEFKLLLQHAVCLACLQGNCFEDLIEQYCVEAYISLWQNSQVGEGKEIPNVLGVSAFDFYRRK